jgi:translation initiation factor 3 subunit B
MGTYIATLHRQGLRLWGGASWGAQQRFAHPLVKLIDFSPSENYLVTWSHDPIVVPEGAPQGPMYFSPEDEGNNIAVWDIKTGNLLRTFPTLHSDSDDGGKKQMAWPALKWSYDDKYVARVTPGQQISVYELPSMVLHGKKHMKVEGIVDLEWCPIGDSDREDAEKDAQGGKGPKRARENLLAYWTPEVSNQPARVTLIDFPSRNILRQKNLFSVTDVSNSHFLDLIIL